MTTAATIEASVEAAIKVPANTRVDAAEPCPLTARALTNVPASRNAKPVVAKRRAAVVEKNATKRIKVNGLSAHQGSEPGPPGLDRNERFGPPPGIYIPISPKRRDG